MASSLSNSSSPSPSANSSMVAKKESPAKQLDRILFPETPIPATANLAAGLNGDPTDANPSTLNGDDGADGEWESNPLEELEDDLDKLTTTLAAVGCSPVTVDRVIKERVDTATLTAICKQPDAHVTLENELAITSGITRAKLVARMTEASQTAATPSPGRTYPGTDGSTQPALSLSAKEVFPKIPSGKTGGITLPTATVWKEYGVAIEGYLQLCEADELVGLLEILFKKPNVFLEHADKIQLTEARDSQADLRWANQIFCSATDQVKKLISKKTANAWHGKRSGVMMVATGGVG